MTEHTVTLKAVLDQTELGQGTVDGSKIQTGVDSSLTQTIKQLERVLTGFQRVMTQLQQTIARSGIPFVQQNSRYSRNDAVYYPGAILAGQAAIMAKQKQNDLLGKELKQVMDSKAVPFAAKRGAFQSLSFNEKMLLELRHGISDNSALWNLDIRRWITNQALARQNGAPVVSTQYLGPNNSLITTAQMRSLANAVDSAKAAWNWNMRPGAPRYDSPIAIKKQFEEETKARNAGQKAAGLNNISSSERNMLRGIGFMLGAQVAGQLARGFADYMNAKGATSIANTVSNSINIGGQAAHGAMAGFMVAGLPGALIGAGVAGGSGLLSNTL